MLTKLNTENQLKKVDENGIYFSSPISVEGKIRYELPQKIIDTCNQQTANGYEPSSTLNNKADGQGFPIQTVNIKKNAIYEGIEREGDRWMNLVCDTARKSIDDKGGPFGSLILQIDKASNEIIRYWENHNQVTLVNDPTAHAEVMGIRSVCKSLGVYNLGEIRKEDSNLDQAGEESYCVIYSSAEPCPMCYSAICWANIPILLFAATRYDAAVDGVDFSDEDIYDELERAYPDRKTKVYQCTTSNSLDAFNLWKNTEKKEY